MSVGGALVSRGMNASDKPWRVAIQKPTDQQNAVQAIVDINGHGISTSGSYRNYYELDGKRISHVIDPQTGRPITHNLVSVTVIAPHGAGSRCLGYRPDGAGHRKSQRDCA
ncbi:Thiamine biosynthesis lipoprotein ApbE precursor [Leclercia adecarboxylata]|uniref:FAD:protein FMN transferase n=1 Tax=Leclercia adecarboxylata TaxID=83655 RepID=A0A4U9I5A9_9ENTR|nr:Thiamine biosynthesis lipoprotein ApbE precursor [Leclercia adecarboxylata]